MSVTSQEKEKAKELIYKFKCWRYVTSEGRGLESPKTVAEVDYPAMKKWATICVKELIEYTPRNGGGWKYEYGADFWEKVKQEIENYEK